MCTTPAIAVNFTHSGFTGTLAYTEPTTNIDGTPLTDLDRTQYRYGNTLDGFGDWVVVPATSLTGGGKISLPNVTIGFPSDTTVTAIIVEVVACDNALARNANNEDNCSPPQTITVTVDMVPPAAVQ